MGKHAISVTLDTDNLLWLRGRVGAAGQRSVSQLLNRLVTEARAAGAGGPGRSVVGTIDIDPGDPFLERADRAVRAAFDRSLGRALVAKERAAAYASARPRKRRG